jgi:hypothetical protein
MLRLLERIDADRVTLREDIGEPGSFPITHEALAHGAASLRSDTSVASRTAPTIRKLLRDRAIVVVDDTFAVQSEDPEYDDDGFRRMLVAYGDLRAFMVGAVFAQARPAAVVAVHQLGAPRRWRRTDLDALQDALEGVDSARGYAGTLTRLPTSWQVR